MFVIAGVTGKTGSVVADALLAKGKPVRVVVREASKGEAWRVKGAEVGVATLDDAAALGRALEGADGAYLLSPPDLASPDFLGARRKTVDAIATAIDHARVPHVVFLSSIGGQHESGTGIIETVAYAERRLAKTSAKTTFLRPAYFLENWASVLPAARAGTLPTFLPIDLTIPMIASHDIGLAAANALLEGPPAGKTQAIELAGPRDWSSREIAAILTKLVGKTVTAEAAPTSAVVPAFTSFGISPDVAELFRRMYEGILDGKVAFEGNGTRFVRGATSAEAVLAQLLA